MFKKSKKMIVILSVIVNFTFIFSANANGVSSSDKLDRKNHIHKGAQNSVEDSKAPGIRNSGSSISGGGPIGGK